MYCCCCQEFLAGKVDPVYLEDLETTGSQVEKEVQVDQATVDPQGTGVIQGDLGFQDKMDGLERVVSNIIQVITIFISSE